MIRALAIYAIALGAISACGDNTAHTTDAPGTQSGCTATFSGNFAETSTAPDNCPSVSGNVVSFNVPVTALSTSLAVMLDLGTPPTIGTYSSQSAPTWTATATQNIGGRFCFYTAGSATGPHGSFMLTIDAIDGVTAHGQLAVLQYVLSGLNAKCGPNENETVTVTF
jgi:hypothetical protein